MQIFKEILNITDKNLDITSELKMIKDDIKRTVSGDIYYQPLNKGYKKMFEVLKAFTLYDKLWGYVQGMNFIIAALVYHCDASTAFWLFLSLIEDYHLRKNYIEGLEGLYNRCDTIDNIIKIKDPKMYAFLKEKEVQIQMIAIEPIMSLFWNLVPLELSHLHFNGFFEQGWVYFYKLFLEFLRQISSQIYACEDMYEILKIFKDYYHKRVQDLKSHNQRCSERQSLDSSSIPLWELNWKEMIENACSHC